MLDLKTLVSSLQMEKAIGNGADSNTDQAHPLTPETLSQGLKAISERGAEPTQRLVSPQAWSLFEQYRADPRMAHHPEALLLAYAEAGARPPLRTASYALGKSFRRKARRERRKAKR